MPGPVESAPCSTCGGAGYVVEQVLGKPAQARRCSCQATCPRCRGSGFVLVPDASGARAQECACRHLDARIGLFNRVGIPAALAKASLEGFKSYSPDHVAAKKVAQDFAHAFRSDKPSKGFLFYGRPGGGKTHLLAATLRWLTLEKGVPCRYVEFMLLLSDIKAGFDSGRNQMEILRPLIAVPVLAIDELGKERGTEWERSMLDELISRRYNGGLATLFATNYFLDPRASPEEPGRVVQTRSKEFQRDAESMSLSQRVGDRVYSRLNEMCTLQRLDPNVDMRKDGAGGYWGR
jgi:DNA replication protein DnaC